MSPDEDKNESQEQEQPEEPTGGEEQAQNSEEKSSEEQKPEGQSPEEQESAQTTPAADGPPQFQNLKEDVQEDAQAKNINFLYDIELDVNVELGRAELKVRDILSLQPGSVVELNRLAGDPVEIIINNRLIARGEVIVIDDNFAVRVTDILSPSEIVTTLGASY